MNELNDLLYLTHTNIDLPKGILLCSDEDVVQEGDILIDNNRETPFVQVSSTNAYAELIGGTALNARLSPLCYEIYREI